jgi:hypothetical protein
MSYLRKIVRKAGTLIGVRRTINLIEGTHITLTVTDDVANDRVNVTINGQGGSGGSWGSISGTLSSQTDLQTALNGKLATPTGTPDGTKYLRDDNTWQPVSGGSGLSQQQVEGII